MLIVEVDVSPPQGAFCHINALLVLQWQYPFLANHLSIAFPLARHLRTFVGIASSDLLPGRMSRAAIARPDMEKSRSSAIGINGLKLDRREGWCVLLLG